MGYCSVAQVQQRLVQDVITSTSKLTATQAQAIIDDVASELNATIEGLGFTTPIAAPGYFVAYLARLNGHGAAADVLRSWFPDVTGPGEQPAYAFWEKLYQEGLAALVSGERIPPGLSRNDRYTAPSTYFTNNPDVDVDLGLIANPVFTMGKQF